MNTISERLIYVLAEKNKIASDLARVTGLSRAIISQYTTGKKEPTPSTAVTICSALNLSYDFLMLGKGESKDKFDKDRYYSETYGSFNPEDGEPVKSSLIKVKKIYGGEMDITFRLGKSDVTNLIAQMMM